MINLLNGDCLELLKDIPDGSVDLVLTDPPYGVINCEWDSVIPLEPMWAELKRVVKPDGAILMFSTQPFTTKLISSNLAMFKFEIIWDKVSGMGLNAKKMPIKSHENIIVFYDKRPVYNPQMVEAEPENLRPIGRFSTSNAHKLGECSRDKEHHASGLRYPRSVQRLSYMSGECNSRKRVHPTQKPVELLEWLVKTYSNAGDTVLDFTCGSGSTGVAAVNTGRKFIGIELDKDYFEIAQKRINEALEQVKDNEL